LIGSFDVCLNLDLGLSLDSELLWIERFRLMGSWYILLAHPEDRALLESNLSAEPGR
jgi:hypothetical protein